MTFKRPTGKSHPTHPLYYGVLQRYQIPTEQFEADLSIAWTQLTGTPTTIAGYGITDAYTKTEVDAFLALYYTKVQLDGGQLDTRYFTETELDAGQLDNRYYTETEVDALLAGYSTVGHNHDSRYYTETEADALFAAISHVHAAADVTSGTFADARIAQSNVTQHQAALALGTGQITSGTFADARIAQSNVTQHQAALAIAYGQLTYSGLTAGHVLKATGASAASFGALAPTQLSGWPANAAGKLTNDGSGNLSWAAGGSGTIDGSGTTGKIPKWSDSDTLTDSILSESGSNLIHGQTTLGIFADTSDGSDNKRIILGGGGDNSATRGALVLLYGNEFSVNPGNLHLFAGATGVINMRGHTYFDTDNTHDLGSDALSLRPRSGYFGTGLTVGSTLSGSGMTFKINGGAGAAPNLQFYTSATGRGIIGTAAASSDICSGTVEGDMVFRVSGKEFYFTRDGGSSYLLKLIDNVMLFNGPAFELGNTASAAHTYIDFHSDGTAGDYNARIIRFTGTDGEFQLEQTGTGGIRVSPGSFGVMLDQGGNDGAILKFISSDIAHGITTFLPTDCYAKIQKYSATLGGVEITGATEGSTPAVSLFGMSTTALTTKSTSAGASVSFAAALKSGTGITNMSANGNLVAVLNNGTTRFILDGDGDSHQDVGTAWTNFDTHDDIALLNLMSAHVTRQDDPLRASFSVWLDQSRDELERVRLVQFNDDGHHFVNMSRLTMLLTGAVRQLGAQLQRMEAHMAALGLPPLPPLLNP